MLRVSARIRVYHLSALLLPARAIRIATQLIIDNCQQAP
jgi:hypothetical protein